MTTPPPPSDAGPTPPAPEGPPPDVEASDHQDETLGAPEPGGPSFDGGALTVGEFFSCLAPEYWAAGQKEAPLWPPDAFAMVAALLHRTGWYRHVIRSWPPAGHNGPEGWSAFIQRVGREWRGRWHTKEPPSPPEMVCKWWDALVDGAGAPLDQFPADGGRLCEALLQLCAAADEASEGVGVARSENDFEEGGAAEGPQEAPVIADGEASADEARREYLRSAEQFLVGVEKPGGATLCERIHASRVRVLPKMRTSQRGLTLRSFTLHLSFCQASEVEPLWRITPRVVPGPNRESLNLLVVPWPLELSPAQFVPHEKHPTQMPERFGLFEVTMGPDEGPPRPDGRPPGSLVDHVKHLYDRAYQLVGGVDGVVLPELAVSPEQYAAARDFLREKGCFLIAGVSARPAGSSLGANYVECSFPFPGAADETPIRQHKHHRWALDRSQIVNYGLAARLDPRRVWWEAIEIEKRQLRFFAIEDWLTLCVLICEDLARQDPDSEMVRAVGPNLVIALLMDGPQLQTRWPHQYAGVLADDPGSAVLTLTSLGMTGLSRPFDRQAPSRKVGLWKDGRTGAVEIDLPAGADAVVLSLASEWVEEYTADARSDTTTEKEGLRDDPSTPIIFLGGIHPIRL